MALIDEEPPITLPRGQKNPPAPHPLLFFGGEAPVGARVADCVEKPGGDGDPEPVVARRGLKDQHALPGIGGESVGEHAARGAGADDDVVEFFRLHRRVGPVPPGVLAIMRRASYTRNRSRAPLQEDAGMKRKLRSNFDYGTSRWAVRRAQWRALGLTDEDMEKPKIAVVNSSSELSICYSHLDGVAKVMKEAIRAAGGLPFEIRTMAPSDFITSAGRAGAHPLPRPDPLPHD